MKKILFYRRGGLGDTLLTFPIVELLKKVGFLIDYVGNTDYLKLLKEVGWVDNIFGDFPKNLNSYNRIYLLATENFLEFPNVVLINPFPQKREHVLNYYLRKFGLQSEPSKVFPLKGFNFWKDRVVLHPGSGSIKKNAPLELFVELYLSLERLGKKPLFVLGEAELHLEEHLKGFETYRVEDIVKFAKLLKRSKAFVGNDSGFTHLAGYLGVPTIALFGPTDPTVWKPIGPYVEVLYKNLDCSPCFPKECFLDEKKKCLKLITVREILEKLKIFKVF